MSDDRLRSVIGRLGGSEDKPDQVADDIFVCEESGVLHEDRHKVEIVHLALRQPTLAVLDVLINLGAHPAAVLTHVGREGAKLNIKAEEDLEGTSDRMAIV